MAKRAKIAGKVKAKGKKTGLSSSDKVIKTRSMDAVIGIQELKIPETLEAMEQVASDVSLGKKISPPILRSSVNKNLEASFAQAEKETVDARSARKKSVKINFEDIAEENMEGCGGESRSVSKGHLHYQVLEHGNERQNNGTGNRRKVLKSVVNLGPRITEAHKAILLAEYTEKEVKEALFSIPGIKAPGPNGFGSAFYQVNWTLVRLDFVAAILSFLSTGKMLKEINTTAITLIPKVACPKSVMDFRPNSCCNVLYKTATKVICNRLRRVLPDFIAENQGGFVHGRYIAHNMLVCQDLERLYGRKNCKPSCMIKIDLRKAYDTVEWGFLEEMLMEFGFPDHFIKLIMICIRTPKFSLLLNGSMCGFFNAKRDLRQGDPISPLLFVLGMEYLSRIFQKIENCHICSGMSNDEVGRILEASQFKRSTLPFRYLGIPICSKKISIAECQIILEKMVGRIRVWSTRNLFYMGRVTLINVVLISIHAYWAQMLLLPKKLLKEIEAICRSFLWKGIQAGAGPGLVAWEQVYLPKGAGGLGLRNIQKWNIAAMTRYVWDIANKKDCLFVKWIHNVYLKDKHWWDYEAPTDCSWAWKKLVEVKNQLKLKTDLASFTMQNFSVSRNYQLLYSSPEKKHWCHYVWDRVIIPKHKFILWLVLWGRLNTKEREVSDGSEEEPELGDTSNRLTKAAANFQQDEKCVSS
uniref:Reverse transcriptase domain-containing protein n=1 Tax=Cannabis sativa TaxID=3483 RepID=A0A803QDE1_CANSA